MTLSDVDIRGLPIPAAGPSRLTGRVITVPFAATTVDKQIINLDCELMGWSIVESSGVAGATAELYDGSSNAGSFLASLALNQAADLAASQTPADATASGANAVQTATITPAAGIFAFIQSLRITGLGATAAIEVTATLTGVQGGTVNYPVSVPAGVAVPITPVEDTFPGRGAQGSAAGGAISLTLPAFGAGNTLESASIQGYFVVIVGFVDTRWFGPDGIYIQSGLMIHPLSGSVKGAVWIRS